MIYIYKGKLFHGLKLGQMASQIRVVDVGQFICEGLSHSKWDGWMGSLLSHAGYTTPAKMANVNFDLGTLVMVVNSPPFLDSSSI